jgi:hypothetical protein
MICFLAAGPVQAASKAETYCHPIQDSDLRAHCLARTKIDKQYCYRIKAKDKKNTCLAEVTGESGYCLRISDKDLRNACRASP